MITITTQPQYIQPSQNPMLFTVEDADAESLFFRVTIYEVGTDKILGAMKVFKSPTEQGNFVDVSSRLSDFTSTEIDNTSNLYNDQSGAVNYYCTFESVTDNNLVLSSITTDPKWAIRAGGDVLNGVNWDLTDWYMNVNTIGVKYGDFLTSLPKIQGIFIFQKQMLYFLADGNSGITNATINVYKKDGTLLTQIVEPIDISQSPYILHRLYVQPNLLAANYDFDITQMGSMDVALYADDVRISQLRKFIIDPAYNCSVDKVNILWENYEGGIDTHTFINPRETKNVTRQTIQTNGYAVQVNNVYAPLTSVISTAVISTYKVTSLGMKEQAYSSLSNIIGTLNSWVELGDGSLWGIVLDNTSLEVKRRKYETRVIRMDLSFKSLPNLDLINRGEVLIAPDDTPNPFGFVPVTEANFNQQYTSNQIQITGINVTVPVTVTGGQYRINNGIWTSAPGIANNGDQLQLRVTTTQSSEQAFPVTVTVGQTSGTYTVTTKAIQNTPATITFTPQTDTQLNVTVYSNTQTISGINVTIPVSITNGQYSINGGAYTSAAGTLSNGDVVTIAQTTANASLTAKTSTLTYGSKTATFTTTTREYDITPNDFSFTNLTNQPVNTVVTSNTITVGGITDPVSISITNGTYSINSGAFVATSGTVVNGDTVQLKTTTPANAGQDITVTLTISNKSGDWLVSTTAPDTTPDQFTFTDKTGQALSTYIESNIVTITGINVSVNYNITNTSYTQVRKNGGSWSSASGSVVVGDTLQLRILSSSSYETALTSTLTVGSTSDTFSVTTMPTPTVELKFAYTEKMQNFVSGQSGFGIIMWTSEKVTTNNINAKVNITVGQSGSTEGPYTVQLLTAASGTYAAKALTGGPYPIDAPWNIQVVSCTPAKNSTVNGSKTFHYNTGYAGQHPVNNP